MHGETSCERDCFVLECWRTGDAETLHLTFSEYEVQIQGHALRDLLLGIQDFAIK